MQAPFIHNHQLNLIHKQADFLLKTMRSVADRQVLETVKGTAAEKIIASFHEVTIEQRHLLEQLSHYETAHDLQNYLDELDQYVVPFPSLSEQQIQKLFPKVKKLKVPNLALIDYNHVTYLRWIDIATNRLYIVYPYENRWIGIEGQMNSIHKNGFCMFCNRHRELGFFNVKTKSGGSADHFAFAGQYICMDDVDCNHSITDTSALEKFLISIVK